MDKTLSPMEVMKTIITVVASISMAFLMSGCSSFPEDSGQPTLPLHIVQAGQILSGKVIGIIDGETVKIQTSSNIEFRVRLAEIDVPERYQAFGDKAQAALADKTIGKVITLRVISQDQYGGLFALVYIGNRWINREMVAEGWAWNGEYSRITELAQAEREARAKKRGLWADDNPMPPWEYRRLRTSPPEEHDRNDARNIQPLLKMSW